MKCVEEETGNLDATTERPWHEVKKGYTAFQDNDVIFAKITPCMENGKFAIARGLKGGRAAGSTEFHVLRPNERLAPHYLMHFLFQHHIRQDARMNMRGAAGQLRVPTDFFESLKIPLPPLPTQHRIVAEIEEKLSRLDAAQSALLRAQANLKRYRASVLYSQYQTDFSKIALGDLGKWFGGGTPSKSNDAFWTNGTIPWVSPKDMKVFRISTAEDFITEAACTRSSTSRVKSGSILIVARSGILQHTLPVAVTDVEVTINQDLKALEPKSGVSAEYVAYALIASENELLHQYTKEGTTVQNINFSEFKRFEIPLPSLDTQRKIVIEAERRLSVIDRTEQTLRTQLERAKRLRQSILQQAFSPASQDA